MDPNRGKKVNQISPKTMGKPSCGLLLLVALMACLCWLSGCGSRLGQAQSLEQEGDALGALALYAEIIESEPDNQEALEGAAVCLLALKRFDEALVMQEKLAAMDPVDAQIRLELGFNYLNHQDRAADAVRVLAEAAELEPTARNFCYLAQAHIVVGDTELAERDLDQAIDKEASYPYSYKLLAKLLQSQGRTEEAEAVVGQAASLGIVISGTTF